MKSEKLDEYNKTISDLSKIQVTIQDECVAYLKKILDIEEKVILSSHECYSEREDLYKYIQEEMHLIYQSYIKNLQARKGKFNQPSDEKGFEIYQFYTQKVQDYSEELANENALD